MSDQSNIKQKLNRGIAWVGLAASMVALLDIIALVLILKFWVSRADYGIATVVVTLFWALEAASEAGLAAAIIQKDGQTEERISTLFWLNIMFGATFFVLVYAGAPYMAKLHGYEIITDLFRLYAINFFFRAAYTTHQALLKKELRFKELSVVRIVANFAEFFVKIGTAAAGYGVWCFVFGPLARSLVYGIGVPLVHRWVPRFVFRFRETLPDITFGLRTAASEILYQFYSNMDYQIVSMYFGAAALGLYRAAYELVLEPIRFLSGVVVGIAFPAFSRLKNDLTAVSEQFIAFTKQNLVVVLSLVALILVAAEDMLVVVIKPEYAGAADAARILGIVGVLRALSHIGPPLLDGLGRPELSLRYQAVATVLLTSMFVLFAELFGSHGIISVAAAWAVGYPFAFALLLYTVLNQINLSLGHYVRSIIGIPVCIAVSCGLGFGVRELTAGFSPQLRLAAIAVAVLGTIGLLLAYTQGISPRSVARSMKE